jgi:hypothetical protein
MTVVECASLDYVGNAWAGAITVQGSAQVDGRYLNFTSCYSMAGNPCWFNEHGGWWELHYLISMRATAETTGLVQEFGNGKITCSNFCRCNLPWAVIYCGTGSLLTVEGCRFAENTANLGADWRGFTLINCWFSGELPSDDYIVSSVGVETRDPCPTIDINIEGADAQCVAGEPDDSEATAAVVPSSSPLFGVSSGYGVSVISCVSEAFSDEKGPSQSAVPSLQASPNSVSSQSRSSSERRATSQSASSPGSSEVKDISVEAGAPAGAVEGIGTNAVVGVSVGVVIAVLAAAAAVIALLFLRRSPTAPVSDPAQALEEETVFAGPTEDPSALVSECGGDSSAHHEEAPWRDDEAEA